MLIVDRTSNWSKRDRTVVNSLLVCLFVATAVFSASLYASHEGQFKKIDGMSVYLVVMPAEMLEGHPKDHPESTMHPNKRIAGVNQHHFMVSVFNQNSEKLLNGLVIEARVFGRKFKGSSQKLELMIMGNSQSYGNFFTVPKQGAYRVELEIQLPDKAKSVKVTFDYASA